MSVDDERDVLKIMSFNVYDHICNADDRTPRRAIDESECDIVCTQEEPEEPEDAENTEHYTRLSTCGRSNEIVGVYYKKNLESPPEFVDCIETTPAYRGVRRYAILFTYKGILIANLHLEGGRYTDAALCDVNVDNNAVYGYKMELLREVMRRDPDIIMGDFNSVYSSNQRQLRGFLRGQSTYFNSKCPGVVSNSFIEKWNTGPFIALQENYTYAEPTNQSETYTSALGKSIVDTIWYKTDTNKFTFMESTIKPIVSDPFDSENCSYSDHNPVLLAIKLTNGGGRRLRRRTVHKQRRSHRKRKTQRKNRR